MISIARAGLPLALAAALACATSEPDPRFRPTENVLEALAVLRLHVDDDTYRFPPARDFTGKNVYRATLTRLDNLEEIESERLKSGYLVDVILFGKARALERITEYDLAARHYERVAALDSPLRDDAIRSQQINERLAPKGPLQPGADVPLEEATDYFDARVRALEELEREVEGTHYAPVVREEIERSDVARARYFRARRLLEPGLDAVAVQQYQRLIQRHRESKLRSRHLLELADLYAELARGYAAGHPPQSLGFDAATFDEYSYSATRIYEAISQRDGAVEKIEAARKLEAFLAFTLQVYDDKLPR